MAKRIPARTCAVCKGVFPKEELLRVVRTSAGEYMLDPSGKADGRGAYLCKNPDCLDKCLKKKLLNRSFKAQLPESVYEAIAAERRKN